MGMTSRGASQLPPVICDALQEEGLRFDVMTSEGGGRTYRQKTRWRSAAAVLREGLLINPAKIGQNPGRTLPNFSLSPGLDPRAAPPLAALVVLMSP